MDLELFKADGKKLNEPAEDVGADSEQLTAQHKRDASAAGVLSLLFALSQHFIILLFGEWSGVPERTLLARAKRKKDNISRRTIKYEYMSQPSIMSTIMLMQLWV